MLIETAGGRKENYCSLATVVKGAGIQVRFEHLFADKVNNVGLIRKDDQLLIPAGTEFMLRNTGTEDAEMIFILIEDDDDEERQEDEEE